MSSRPPKRILFLCKGNSCRSQMAEGFARRALGDEALVFSAGESPRPVHPLAVQTLRELGLDISHQKSKPVSVFEGEAFDYVITVCDRETEECPSWTGVRERIVWSVEDPAAATGSDAEQLRVFRQVALVLQQRVNVFILSAKLGGRPHR